MIGIAAGARLWQWTLAGPHRGAAPCSAILRCRLLVCALVAAVAGTLPTSAWAIDLKVVEEGDPAVTTILLAGKMDAGDGLKVRGFVGGLSTSKPIVAQLAFGSGIRADAISIGRFFHDRRIRTVVVGKQSRCISPCPLVLVGGLDPITGKPAAVKYSNATVGFTSVALNYREKEYTVKDLDTAVANTQRDILQIADYLHAVGANLDLLRYYQSVLKVNDVKYLSNEEALDLGIAVLIEDSGQLIEPTPPHRR